MREAKVFVPSIEKQIIREEYDKPLVEDLSRTLRRRLRYFGLPGPYMNDILTWQHSVESCVCVEYDENLKDLLLEAAFISGFSSRMKVVRANIEDYIARILSEQTGKPFDIVNLDYFGPPLNITNTGESYRFLTMERLFEFQARSTPQPFVLFLTTGVRNKDRGQIAQMLESIRRHALGTLVPAPTDPEHLKMKVIVPYLVRAAASRQRWDVRLRYSFTYSGTENVRMVHFAFEVSPVPLIVVDHEQTIADVCLLPMFEIKGQNITPLL